MKRAFKGQYRNAYFGSLVYSGQKLWPCKKGGWQNSGKERYLSKTPFLTFVYLSKCDTKLRGIFGNAKKSFSLTGLMIIDQKSLESEKLSLQQTLC